MPTLNEIKSMQQDKRRNSNELRPKDEIPSTAYVAYWPATITFRH